MPGPDVRKGMPPRRLDRAAFEQRYRSAFKDPAFTPLASELNAIAAAAWDAYDIRRWEPPCTGDFIPGGELMMVENPKCPNCGHRMTLARQPAPASEQHTFECEKCHLLFMTEDHQPVSGPAIHSSKNL